MVNPIQVTPTKFTRVVEGLYDITTDGVNPTLGVFNFSLNDLPSYTEFTALFDQYKIERIEIEWFPEYTELTDASVLSSAKNVQLNTAIDTAGATPAAVDDVLQFRTLHTTGITKNHKRDFKPAYLIDSISPGSVYLNCSSPSSNWWGVAYGINPSGVAMVFRSRAKFYLSMACAK